MNADSSPIYAAEYTVYRHVLESSTFGAVLNEKDISTMDKIQRLWLES